MFMILALGLVLAGGVLARGWTASERAAHPPSGGCASGLSDFPTLTPELVTFRSKTGVSLAGRFFAGRCRATIILSHGYGGNQDEMLSVADVLLDAGFTVFTYDLRGCGQSGGAVTFGVLEQDDLISAVDYLMSRPDVDPDNIGALGFSMGAATTILAAARDARIKAVVDDSGWSDVYHWLRPSRRPALRRAVGRFSALSLKLVELRNGVDLGTLRPIDEIPRIGPRPILFIHGTADGVVPPGDGEQNFAAAREEKELWLISGAGHGDTLRLGGAAYAGRIVAFFEQALHPTASA